jgi:microcystin-dependent protein
MSNPFIGEIRMFAGNFAPMGWAFCNGAQIPISENPTLFQLIGTTYGGDGQQTFNLPDLRGRVPMHQGAGFLLAQFGGAETVTLTTQQIPSHGHPYLASTDLGNANSPQENVLANTSPASLSIYYGTVPTAAMGPNSIGNSGGNLPHENLQPYLTISFILSLVGIFPSQT